MGRGVGVEGVEEEEGETIFDAPCHSAQDHWKKQTNKQQQRKENKRAHVVSKRLPPIPVNVVPIP